MDLTLSAHGNLANSGEQYRVRVGLGAAFDHRSYASDNKKYLQQTGNGLNMQCLCGNEREPTRRHWLGECDECENIPKETGERECTRGLLQCEEALAAPVVYKPPPTEDLSQLLTSAELVAQMKRIDVSAEGLLVAGDGGAAKSCVVPHATWGASIWRTGKNLPACGGHVPGADQTSYQAELVGAWQALTAAESAQRNIT